MSVIPLEDAPVQLVIKALNVLVAKKDTSKMTLIAKVAIVIQVEVMAKNVAPMANAIADLNLKEKVVILAMMAIMEVIAVHATVTLMEVQTKLVIRKMENVNVILATEEFNAKIAKIVTSNGALYAKVLF